MPVSVNTVSVTGSSAFFDVQASGSGFGIFSSYSTYASEAFSYTGSSTAGTGSFGLTLDTPFGNLVFTGTDTISATASAYSVMGSENLSFVIGKDTLSSLSGGFATSGSTFTQLGGDLNDFYTAVKPIIALADTVASAAAADIASDVMTILTAGTPTIVGGTGTTVTQQGVQFNFTKLG